MTDIHIPPEAVEAAAIDLYRSVYPAPQYHSWAETPEWTRKIWREHAIAAIRAALAAWPGVGIFEDETGWDVHIELPLVILLNTENPDAES